MTGPAPRPAVRTTTSTTHRAIVRHATGIRVRHLPTPEPAAGELLIAPEIAGLCGTDLQMLRGLRDDPAPVIGHEGTARIVSAGQDLGAQFTPGTRVVVNPTHPEDPSFLLGHNVDGLLQERVLLPASALTGGLVLPIGDGIQPELASLLEPLAVVRYSLGILHSFTPRTLVVVGDGIIGHLAVRAARRWLGPGVQTVLVHHTATGKAWSAAQPHGPDVRLDAGEPAPCGEGPAAAIVATPRDATVQALDYLLGLAKPGLAIDLVGGLPPGAGTPLLPGADLVDIRAANCGGLPRRPEVAKLSDHHGRDIHLLGHRGVSNTHLREAEAELRRDPERYRELVTHTCDLDEAAHVMNHLARTRDRTIEGTRLVKMAVHVESTSSNTKDV